MHTYVAPVEEIALAIKNFGDLAGMSQTAADEGVTEDLVRDILNAAGKFAGDVLAPLNAIGDAMGAKLENGVVRTPHGYRDAYRQFVDMSWQSLSHDVEIGGQGLPALVGTGVNEIWHSANMAWALCPMLTNGAISCLARHADDRLSERYLPRLITGEWTATMNITESHAGSDLAGIKTRAEREGDRYRITGQKIFITYGDHDMCENIVHLVLARGPENVFGLAGLSLYLVPKFLPKDDGSIGERNHLACLSLERKLGIHGSPTALMEFGGGGEGAIGYIIGEEGAGMRCMFTMMNDARLAVGLQGIAQAELAYQVARAFATERIQGAPIDDPHGASVAIIQHPDIRRTLLSMRSRCEAARALAYFVAGRTDVARGQEDPEVQREAQTDVDLLTPIVKAWSTNLGVDIASDAIQVAGGAGYIHETGLAQIYRDIRITPIYEGTNGIQARDFVFRKIIRDDGSAMKSLMARIEKMLGDSRPFGKADLTVQLMPSLRDGFRELATCVAWTLDGTPQKSARISAGAVHLLELAGLVLSAWLLTAGVARSRNGPNTATPTQRRIVSLRFFVEHHLVHVKALGAAYRDSACITANTIERLI